MAMKVQAAAPTVLHSAIGDLTLQPTTDGPTSPLEWKPVSKVWDPRTCIYNIWGPQSSGKTTHGLTAPSPIYFFYSSIEKVDGVMQQAAQNGKTIYPFYFGGYGGSEEDWGKKADLYKPFWRKFWTYYVDAWEQVGLNGGTVELDTETALYQLLCFANFGSLSPKPKRDPATGRKKTGRVDANWAPVNEAWQQLLELPKHIMREHNKGQFVIISRSKPVYNEDNKKTNRIERKGQGWIDSVADVQIRTSDELDIVNKQRYFKSVITKPWANAHAQGREVSSIDGLNTFAGVMAHITATYDPATNAIVEYGDMERWM